jgi:hypothetical protein
LRFGLHRRLRNDVRGRVRGCPLEVLRGWERR